MGGGFRTRIFLATFTVAAAALIAASALTAIVLRRQAYEQIESSLIAETRLAAELLSRRATSAAPAELQAEARTLGQEITARVTFITRDGLVVGDSSEDEPGLARMENHGGRPEVIEAREHGLGVATRFSATLGIDMLYVALPVRHPSIAFVRLALPLTDIRRQLRAVWLSAGYALLLCVAAAVAMAWTSSRLLVRRLERLASGAQRYAAGELRAPPIDDEDDEIGTVARALGETVRRLGERADDLARGQARMEAILAGMVEGVLVVDSADRVLLVNQAAREMMRLDASIQGRHYLECIRHPGVVAQLDAVRRGVDEVDPAIVPE